METETIINNHEIKLAVLLKTEKLKRESMVNLSYEHVYKTLNEFIWKDNAPTSLHQAVNDIMNLDISTVVGYLSVDAIKRGATMRPEQLEDILKGE